MMLSHVDRHQPHDGESGEARTGSGYAAATDGGRHDPNVDTPERLDPRAIKVIAEVKGTATCTPAVEPSSGGLRRVSGRSVGAASSRARSCFVRPQDACEVG